VIGLLRLWSLSSDRAVGPAGLLLCILLEQTQVHGNLLLRSVLAANRIEKVGIRSTCCIPFLAKLYLHTDAGVVFEAKYCFNTGVYFWKDESMHTHLSIAAAIDALHSGATGYVQWQREQLLLMQ
jgi:hypothetical protein